MTASPPRTWLGARGLGLALVALAVGCAIALLDSRPGWDDTGVTVGLLVVGAAIVAWLGGTRPWLWALLVGLPVPMIEVPASGALAPVAALAFAAIGAVLGYVARHAVGTGRP